ncbi:hypothetical protein PAPYR_8153 [Paratrimastix pyriformis]|uniref:Uncharacterized protein n=1 Tax=Paratrimastix pyriformis TaxID=342808 RepID=A0ABQ8UIE0_9EUKA|nr:hypothetical protein PAPYR_8153 [Paratrimastix pyriformis]
MELFAELQSVVADLDQCKAFIDGPFERFNETVFRRILSGARQKLADMEDLMVRERTRADQDELDVKTLEEQLEQASAATDSEEAENQIRAMQEKIQRYRQDEVARKTLDEFQSVLSQITEQANILERMGNSLVTMLKQYRAGPYASLPTGDSHPPAAPTSPRPEQPQEPAPEAIDESDPAPAAAAIPQPAPATLTELPPEQPPVRPATKPTNAGATTGSAHTATTTTTTSRPALSAQLRARVEAALAAPLPVIPTTTPPAASRLPAPPARPAPAVPESTPARVESTSPMSTPPAAGSSRPTRAAPSPPEKKQSPASQSISPRPISPPNHQHHHVLDDPEEGEPMIIMPPPTEELHAGMPPPPPSQQPQPQPQLRSPKATATAPAIATSSQARQLLLQIEAAHKELVQRMDAVQQREDAVPRIDQELDSFKAQLEQREQLMQTQVTQLTARLSDAMEHCTQAQSQATEALKQRDAAQTQLRAALKQLDDAQTQAADALKQREAALAQTADALKQREAALAQAAEAARLRDEAQARAEQAARQREEDARAAAVPDQTALLERDQFAAAARHASILTHFLVYILTTPHQPNHQFASILTHFLVYILTTPHQPNHQFASILTHFLPTRRPFWNGTSLLLRSMRIIALSVLIRFLFVTTHTPHHTLQPDQTALLERDQFAAAARHAQAELAKLQAESDEARAQCQLANEQILFTPPLPAPPAPRATHLVIFTAYPAQASCNPPYPARPARPHQLTQLAAQVSQLRAQLSDVQQQRDQAHAQTGQALDQRDEATRQCDETHAQLCHAQAQLADLAQQRDQALADLTQARQALEAPLSPVTGPALRAARSLQAPFGATAGPGSPHMAPGVPASVAARISALSTSSAHSPRAARTAPSPAAPSMSMSMLATMALTDDVPAINSPLPAAGCGISGVGRGSPAQPAATAASDLQARAPISRRDPSPLRARLVSTAVAVGPNLASQMLLREMRSGKLDAGRSDLSAVRDGVEGGSAHVCVVVAAHRRVGSHAFTDLTSPTLIFLLFVFSPSGDVDAAAPSGSDAPAATSTPAVGLYPPASPSLGFSGSGGPLATPAQGSSGDLPSRFSHLPRAVLSSPLFTSLLTRVRPGPSTPPPAALPPTHPPRSQPLTAAAPPPSASSELYRRVMARNASPARPPHADGSRMEMFAPVEGAAAAVAAEGPMMTHPMAVHAGGEVEQKTE